MQVPVLLQHEDEHGELSVRAQVIVKLDPPLLVDDAANIAQPSSIYHFMVR